MAYWFVNRGEHWRFPIDPPPSKLCADAQQKPSTRVKGQGFCHILKGEKHTKLILYSWYVFPFFQYDTCEICCWTDLSHLLYNLSFSFGCLIKSFYLWEVKLKDFPVFLLNSATELLEVTHLVLKLLFLLIYLIYTLFTQSMVVQGASWWQASSTMTPVLVSERGSEEVLLTQRWA